MPSPPSPLDLDVDLHRTPADSGPGSAGRAWRERLHAALEKHRGLTPEAILDRLLEQLPVDPVGVFKALTNTLPKELDLRTEPQQQHLAMLRLISDAKARNIDLSALLEPPTVEGTAVEAGETAADSLEQLDLDKLDFLR